MDIFYQVILVTIVFISSISLAVICAEISRRVMNWILDRKDRKTHGPYTEEF